MRLSGTLYSDMSGTESESLSVYMKSVLGWYWVLLFRVGKGGGRKNVFVGV